MKEKYLREGVTTGSCATAAAMASAIWQMEGKCPVSMEVDTPIGKKLLLSVVPVSFGVCGVVKDAGDDPDAVSYTHLDVYKRQGYRCSGCISEYKKEVHKYVCLLSGTTYDLRDEDYAGACNGKRIQSFPCHRRCRF